MRAEQKPKRRLRLRIRRTWEEIKGTLLVICLFVPITLGIPMILPNAVHQVILYSAGAVLIIASKVIELE